MQVTSHIHAIRIPFKLQVSEEVTLDRFVYAYLIYGKKICLIDCGVASSEGTSFRNARSGNPAQHGVACA